MLTPDRRSHKSSDRDGAGLPGQGRVKQVESGRRPPEANTGRLPSSWEMGCARRVQARLFPHALPKVPGWQFAGACRPASALAGDYYDLFALRDGQVVLALGDVTGKGLGPSLVMASIHALVRYCLSHSSLDIERLAEVLNWYLLSSAPDGMFMSLIIGVLDASTGWFRYVNCGHPPPIVLADHDHEPLRPASSNMILGVLPGLHFEQLELLLEPGSVLVLFSDGVTDAADQYRQRFRECRLVRAVQAARLLPAEEMLNRLLRSVDRFTGDTRQEDDMSVVVAQREGTQAESLVELGRARQHAG